jgi:E3 ubiquitin-protein ligase ATL4
MDALPPPAPPAAVHPFAATLPPSLSPPSSSSSLNLSPSLLIIAALLAFVFFASVSIHFLLRCLARSSASSSSHRGPSPLPTRARRASEEEAEAEEVVGSTRRSAAAVGPEEAHAAEVDDEKERLIASLPLFTMASALAALPKSSPDCAVCLSPFSPDADLRLLPACRHAFHAAGVDAWLRTTPSCPLCRAAVSLPHPPLPTAPPLAAGSAQEALDSRVSSSSNSRSFRVEIGSVSNRRSSAAGDDRRTYSLGSFDYRVDEEVEAVVSRITRPAVSAAAKSETQAAPGEALAEAAGSRGWLREYVDRLASSASSLSGRWSARWSQGHHSARWSQGHHSRSHSNRQEDSLWWDPEAAAGAAMHRAPDEEEPGFVALYRWIVGV